MNAARMTALVVLILGLASAALAVNINEIRVDMPSTDNDEYVELAGYPGEPLDGLWYLVIGDLGAAPRCGGIECVVDLAGLTILGDGLLVIGDSATSGLHTFVYDVEADLDFENSDNVTHLIVEGFYGAIDDDVDADEDCVIDPGPPWLQIIDSVALYEGTIVDCLGTDECMYSTTVVGPDGSYVPGHIYLCPESWRIGDFTLGVDDTPGDPNICLVVEPDPFATIPGSDFYGTFVRFGFGVIPPLPADFFGPGSDPFEGQVALEGDPFDPPTMGDTSTLEQRDDHPLDPGDPVGSIGEVQVEIVALDLKSIEPIIVSYDGGMWTEEWDMDVTLSATPAPAGGASATKEHANGGTFTSIFYVQPYFLFTRVSDGMQVYLDTGDQGMPPLEFSIANAPWVHAIGESLDIIAPSDGWFVPGVWELTPGDPSSQSPQRMFAEEFSGAARHTIFPARPIPAPDPHATIPGSEPDGTYVEFGVGDIPPIPADFFGPGSDPFVGQIALDGEPLDEIIYGDASTLVQRSANPLYPGEPPGSSSTVELEIVALDLVSILPITVTYDGGVWMEEWDVQVTLSETAVPPPGNLMAIKTHANGGTFTTDFFVQPLFVFTLTTGPEIRYLDTGQMGMPPLEFSALDGFWVHSVDPALQIIAPSDGWFVPGVEEVIPGDPASQEARRMHANELTGAARHTVFPARHDLSSTPSAILSGLTVKHYPNPFNPQMRIDFGMPREGALTIAVYNLRGELVRILLDEVVTAGPGHVVWDGTDSGGQVAAAGVYFYVAEAFGASTVGKVAFVK